MLDDHSRRDWEGVLSTLSETIQFKSRADANNWRDAFENMKVYMQVGTSAYGEMSGHTTLLGEQSPHL